MKLKILILVLSVQISFSQSIFPTDGGNVGIGTNTPLYKLNVFGSHSDARILLHSIGGGDDARQADLMLWASEPQVSYSGVGIGNNVTVSSDRGLHLLNTIRGGSYMRLLDNSISIGIVSSAGTIKETINVNTEGNIGFGTNSPVSKLSVAGSLTLGGGVGNNTLPRPLITAGTLPNGEIRGYSGAGNAYDDGFLRLSGGGGTTSSVKTFIDLSGYSTVPDMNGNIVFGTYGTERMRIDRNGYVSIGTKAPDALLTVNGTIHSSEVKVNLNFPAPDYVFANDYKLRSLQEVENYIKENSHLPEIPSAKEFEKNGINVSEMNMALLKKVEELTLYSIEQQKNTEKLNLYIDKQQKKYDELTLQLKKQNERLEKLEKKNNN